MSRTTEEFQKIFSEFHNEASAGSGLHYELAARRYSAAIDGFRARITDPVEIERINAFIAKDGDYYRTDLSESQRAEYDLQRAFDAAPKQVASGVEEVRFLDVPAGTTVELPRSVKSLGSVRIGENGVLVAPGVTAVTDSIVALQNARVSLPEVERIGYIGSHTTTELGNGHYEPDFTGRSVDGMDISRVELNHATLEAPKLERLNADLIARGANVTLPALQKLRGALVAEGTATNVVSIDLPQLRSLGTTVTYDVHEELQATPHTSVQLKHCELKTGSLEKIVSSVDPTENAQWTYPMTYNLASRMSRLGELPVETLRTEILKDTNADHRFFTLSSLACSDQLSSQLKRELFLSLSPDLRMFGYLQTADKGLTDADAKAVLASIPPDALRKSDLRVPAVDALSEQVYQTDLRAAAAIQQKLADEGRPHLAPPGLAAAVQQSDRKALARVASAVEVAFGESGLGTRDQVTRREMIHDLHDLASNVSPVLAKAAGKVSEANWDVAGRHPRGSAERNAAEERAKASIDAFWRTAGALAKENTSLAAFELRFQHAETIARFLPPASVENIMSIAQSLREKYQEAVTNRDKARVVASTESLIRDIGGPGITGVGLRVATVAYVKTGNDIEGVQQRAVTHIAKMQLHPDLYQNRVLSRGARADLGR